VSLPPRADEPWPPRARVDRVLVVPGTANIETEVTEPPSRLGAAARGAAQGAAVPVLVLGAVAGPAGVVVGVFLTPIGAAIGAVAGGRDPADPEMVKARLDVLRGVVLAHGPAQALPQRLVGLARGDRPPMELAGPANTRPAGGANDVVLEIAVERLEVTHTTELSVPANMRRDFPLRVEGPQRMSVMLSTSSDPPLTLVLTAQARIVRATDGTVLFTRRFTQIGATRTFTGWSDGDGQMLREGLEGVTEALAAKMLDELL